MTRLTYTHFWSSGPKGAPPVTWNAFLKDAKVLCNVYETFIIESSFALTSMGARRIEFDTKQTRTPFHFEFTAEPQTFVHCRTNRGAADVLITSLLLAAKHHFGSWITITSDGLWDEWKAGIEACKEHLNYKDSDFEATKKDFTSLLDLDSVNTRAP
jgi:hypothetical protein